jgi:hypothetical protein
MCISALLLFFMRYFSSAAASHRRGPCAVGMRPLSVDIRWGIVLTVLVDGLNFEQV